MKKIITISREFGSAGGTIGKSVANKLGFEYYDKELIVQAARDAHITIEDLAKLDEKAPVIFGFTQSLFDLYNSPVEERFYEAQVAIIKKIAEKGNCVIVGRNADSILSAYDDTLHVFIHGDKKWRVDYLKNNKLKDMSVDKIESHMSNIDKARRKFCAYYTKKEFGAASGYDLTLSSSSLGIEKCIDLILQAAR